MTKTGRSVAGFWYLLAWMVIVTAIQEKWKLAQLLYGGIGRYNARSAEGQLDGNTTADGICPEVFRKRKGDRTSEGKVQDSFQNIKSG